jgi:methionine--tRNA ligase beta chain
MISFEEFKKIDLRVARVLEAESMENSEKLLKLKIDIGGEERQLLAGIKQFYNPKDLPGREIVVVANLESKKIMGLESQGMLLAASDEGKPVLLLPENEVPPGTRIF